MALVAARLAEERPDEVALRDDLVALSWADVNDGLNRVATGSMRSGSATPPRRGVRGELRRDVIAHAAGILAGCSAVPVNFHFNADELEYILRDSGTEVLFVGPETAVVEAVVGRQRRAHRRLALRRGD